MRGSEHQLQSQLHDSGIGGGLNLAETCIAQESSHFLNASHDVPPGRKRVTSDPGLQPLEFLCEFVAAHY
jgi:hypothetical protein